VQEKKSRSHCYVNWKKIYFSDLLKRADQIGLLFSSL